MGNEAPAAGDGRRSQRALVALLVTVAAVVVVALIAVLTRSGATEYAEDTPEGVVQRYVQAVIDRDTDLALTYLTPDVVEHCDRIPPEEDERRVTLTRTSAGSDSARVEVMVTTFYDTGLLGSGEYQRPEVFDLARVDSAWRITTTPWTFTICSGTVNR